MTNRGPDGLTLLAAVAVASALLPPAGRADEKEERATLFRAFAEARKAAQKSLSGVKVRTVRSANPSAQGEAHVADRDALKEGMNRVKDIDVEAGGKRIKTKNMVKIWAVLASDDKKVSLTRYEWKPKERFYLCFETTAPIRFALHQTDKGKDPVRILPKAKYTASYATIMPGKTYKMPVRLRMLETDDDEVVTLSVVVVGSGSDPDPVDEDGKIGVRSAEKYDAGMDALLEKVRSKKMRMKSVDFAPRTSSSDEDDVALIAVGAENQGYIELTMRKTR